MARAWALVGLAVAACSEDAYRVLVHVPAPSDRATRVEVSVIGSCGEVVTLGDPPSEPISQSEVSGDAPAPLGALEPGAYGLYARAWDGQCSLYAAGCSPARVEAGGSGPLDVFLARIAERGCAAGQTCADGVCVGPDASGDSGLDAGSDGGSDGGSDARSDSGSDGGPDAADPCAEVRCPDRQTCRGGACFPECEPAIVGSVDTLGEAFGVAVSGTTAYVAASTAGLVVVDVSDPAAPVRLGDVDMGWAAGLAVREPWAFVAADSSGLLTVDVSDPMAPIIVGQVDTVSETEAVALAGNLALVATSGEGLTIADVEFPGDPSGVSTVEAEPPGDVDGVAVSGNLAFIGCSSSGLQIVDFGNPNEAYVAAQLETPGDADDVVLLGSYAFVADDEQGVVVVDVEVTDEPDDVATVALAGSAEGLATLDDLVLVAAQDPDFLHVIDASDPPNAEVIASVEMPHNAEGLAVWGGYAYVADKAGGLVVVDLGCVGR
ncbi:MAG: hypothetical protein HYY06_07715 [Deltaproteobacteria bacterium]|nr:hypothetical protein [Deltaproteobacteria bacterium]